MTEHNLSDWGDLIPFGIQFLTGERCRYGMRMLCDLNAAGACLMQDFLGLACTTDYIQVFQRPWNGQVNGQQAVASVLLPHGCFVQLAVFCLFSLGTQRVWLCEGSVIVPDADQCKMYDEVWNNPDLWCEDDAKRKAAKEAMPYPYAHIEQFAPTCPGAPKSVGGTNQHVMTSR